MQLNFRKSLLAYLWISLDHLIRSLHTQYQRIRQQTQPRLIDQSTRLGEFITEIPVAVEVPPAVAIASRLTPADIAAIQVAEQAIHQQAVHQTMERSPIEPPALPNRAALVTAALDEAWSRHITTYPLLIAYVRQQTGQGCSKRVIANWKRDRGLIDL